MKRLIAILTLLGLGIGTSARAESAADRSRALAGQSPAANSVEEVRNQLLRKLSAKLLNRRGKPVSIVIFTPIDFTTNQVGPVVSQTLMNGFHQYGNLNVREEQHIVESLTVSEFRRGMAEFRADVLVVTSLRNTNFDLYIYDRRTPFYIYAHSEPIPEITQLQINREVAVQYARLLLRRTLYRYINDEYFELPRQDSPPVLQSEIPRWIASAESITRINREILSSFYAAVFTGAALTNGVGDGTAWNQQLLGMKLGLRLYDDLFVELGAHHSAYNAIFAGFRYIFANKDSPYKIGVGLGYSYVTALRVWSNDATFGLGLQQDFLVPSIQLLFPIGDVYLKLEHQAFIESRFQKFMFTLMPGIQLFF